MDFDYNYRTAQVVKLVDAMDSKSIGDDPCRFESDLGHHKLV